MAIGGQRRKLQIEQITLARDAYAEAGGTRTAYAEIDDQILG